MSPWSRIVAISWASAWFAGGLGYWGIWAVVAGGRGTELLKLWGIIEIFRGSGPQVFLSDWVFNRVVVEELFRRRSLVTQSSIVDIFIIKIFNIDRVVTFWWFLTRRIMRIWFYLPMVFNLMKAEITNTMQDQTQRNQKDETKTISKNGKG